MVITLTYTSTMNIYAQLEETGAGLVMGRVIILQPIQSQV